VNTTDIGTYAEDIAQEYLERKQFVLITRNYRYHNIGEIDLIMQDRDYIVFVEVRHRTSTAYGTPEASITPAKIKRLRRTATLWLTVTNRHGTPVRFDVVAVDLVGGCPVVRHLIGCI
jgi:putative endonuclease